MAAYNCECCDTECPECRGLHGRDGAQVETDSILYRIDMEDISGVAFCTECADDAMESGLFTTQVPVEREGRQ